MESRSLLENPAEAHCRVTRRAMRATWVPHLESSPPLSREPNKTQSPTSSSCLGPIILSPLNSPVKMSPHEQGDLRREPERVTTSGGSCCLPEGRDGVCQSRPTPELERAPD